MTKQARMRGVEQGIREETSRLAADFRGVFARETVERCIVEARERFAAAHVDAYLPVLVFRYARELLRAAAIASGKSKKSVPEVLFLCVQNAGRSQIAASLMRRLAGDGVVVRSAGSAPAAHIHPAVVESLREIGLDPGLEFPKPLADDFVRAADVVVTMGCGDACPVFPGKRYVDWDVRDPAGKSVEEVRAIREDIRARVTKLLRELDVTVRSLT